MPISTLNLTEVPSGGNVNGLPVIKTSTDVVYSTVDITANGGALTTEVSYEDNTADHSKNKLVTSLTGGSYERNSPPNIGVNSLVITDTDYLTVNAFPALTDCTISFWFKPTGTGITSDNQTFLFGHTNSDLNIDYDQLSGIFSKVFNTSTGSATQPLLNSVWHYIVIMRKGTTAFVLINGVLSWNGAVAAPSGATTTIDLFGSSGKHATLGSFAELTINKNAIYNIEPAFTDQVYFSPPTRPLGLASTDNAAYAEYPLILPMYLAESHVGQDTTALDSGQNPVRSYLAEYKNSGGTVVSSVNAGVTAHAEVGDGGIVTSPASAVTVYSRNNTDDPFNPLSNNDTLETDPSSPNLIQSGMYSGTFNEGTFIYNFPANTLRVRVVIVTSQPATMSISKSAVGPDGTPVVTTLGTVTSGGETSAPYSYYVDDTPWLGSGSTTIHELWTYTATLSGAPNPVPYRVAVSAFGF